MTRILMPEDWVGHPLRKDYDVGPHPRAVQGRAHRPVSEPVTEAAMTTTHEPTTDDGGQSASHDPFADSSQTSEGGQELTSRHVTDAVERMIEVGAVLRMSEAEAAGAAAVEAGSDGLEEVPDEETMIINMGPQHPSTHGVLRLMLELQGETVLRSKPIIGYLHTGMEWTGEELTYLQGCTNVTRMDYASPLFSELAFSLTVEKLLEHRGARAGHLDPHAHDRAQPHLVAPAVHGHQRHGHRRHLDDALRLARARRGAAVPRERSPACG